MYGAFHVLVFTTRTMAQQGMKNHVPLQQGMKSHEQDSLGDDFFEEADADETKSETISASSTSHGNQNIILDDGIDPSTTNLAKICRKFIAKRNQCL